MKVLLDENLDHALRKLLGQNEVLLTGDGTLKYEENLTGRRLAIVVLSAIQLPIIKRYLPKIITAINGAAPGSFQMVDCGTFSRKKPNDR